MKIKYKNNTFHPNTSPWCIDCAIYKYANMNTCIKVCGKRERFGGFNITDDCEVLEL